MSLMYKSDNVLVGDSFKTLVVINYKQEDSVTTSKSVDSLHHIHLLDRSGSMSSDIGILVENVKKTIEFISDNDYVSIIWFSGEGQFKTLIKGAKKDTNLFPLLDSIKSTVGLTCFSESLQEVGNVISDLKTICPNFNVSLFTDGQPVVSWNDEEERSLKVVDVWKDEVIALNTIGYSNYYNQQFLKDLASKTMFGQMFHSKDIDEYLNIFSHNYERVSDLVLDRVDLTSENNDILYINKKSTKLSKDSISLTMLDKTKNQFVIISDNPIFDFVLNGEIFNSVNIDKKIPAKSLTPCLYTYAYELYIKGNRKNTLDILSSNTVKDRYLYEEQLKAFTFDEVATYTQYLKNAVFSAKSRQLKDWGKDLILNPNSPCAMDVLKILVKGDSLYVFSSNYQRIGLKTFDNFNLFKKDKGNFLTPINELIFNKDKLNISLRSVLTGKVSLNPKQADRVGLPHEIDSYVYRNQTIIKDGSLNIPKIQVLIDYRTYSELEDLKIEGLIELNQLSDISSPTLDLYKDWLLVTLSLDKLPVINLKYLEGSDIDTCLNSTVNILFLEAKQKILNAIKSKIDKTLVDPICPNFYTPDQVEVLSDHGLSTTHLYSAVEAKADTTEDKDFYEARSLTFGIKGSASVPSFGDVVTRINEGKKLNPLAIFMRDYLASLQTMFNLPLPAESPIVNLLEDSITLSDEGMKALLEELNSVRRNLFDARVDMCSIKIAKVLTGDWFEGLTADSKGNYIYTREDILQQGETTLVIKPTKTKVYFS